MGTGTCRKKDLCGDGLIERRDLWGEGSVDRWTHRERSLQSYRERPFG